MSDEFSFANDGLVGGDGFDSYAALYRSTSSRSSGAFYAELKAWRLDRFVLAERRLSGVVHERSEEEHAAADQAVVTLVLEGTVLGSEQSGFSDIGPSDIVLADTRHPAKIEPRDAHLLTVGLPRSVVEAGLGAKVHGTVLRAPANSILANYMCSLARNRRGAAPESMPGLARAFVEILWSAGASGSNTSLDIRRQEFSRREAAERYIAAQLSDRKLSVGTVSRATGVSRSALYRLFDDQGGIANMIRRRRLEALHDAIEAGSHVSWSALAERFGFAGETEMERQYAQAFQTDLSAHVGSTRPSEAANGAVRPSWLRWMTEIA